MNDFLRLAAYTFLALMGISAWNTYAGGWRYYLGIVFFVVCVLRILMILRQRMNKNSRAQSDSMMRNQPTTRLIQTTRLTRLLRDSNRLLEKYFYTGCSKTHRCKAREVVRNEAYFSYAAVTAKGDRRKMPITLCSCNHLQQDTARPIAQAGHMRLDKPRTRYDMNMKIIKKTNHVNKNLLFI